MTVLTETLKILCGRLAAGSATRRGTSTSLDYATFVLSVPHSDDSLLGMLSRLLVVIWACMGLIYGGGM
jgi:hypothetical protein